MGSRRNNQGARSLHCRGYDIVRIGEKDLREVFEKFGKVVDVYLPKDYFTKEVRGFAYIQFESEADADVARLKLDRSDLFGDGRLVNIMWAAGERKTPNDMRRLDIERDNPHARRIREREAAMRRGDDPRDWGRDRRDRRGWDRPRGGRPWDRDWDRDRDRGYGDRDRDRRGFGYGGGRMSSRSPPRPRDRDLRRRDEGRDRGWRDGYERKRLRSRSPSWERGRDPEERRRRRDSRSPPPVRRRSRSPGRGSPRRSPRGGSPRGGRSRSRTPSPRSRSPFRGGDDWRRREGSPRPEDDRGRSGKMRGSAPLSPVETTPASAESR